MKVEDLPGGGRVKGQRLEMEDGGVEGTS